MMTETIGSPDAEAGADVGARIAVRVRGLRTQQGLSLDALAARSGVSRSTISVIERGEGGATAVVLERLATGLGVPLASLFDDPVPPPDPVARAVDQPVWRDPNSGYVRRNVSPPGAGSPLRIVDVSFPPGASVAYETAGREPRVHQQVWLLDGRLDVTVGRRTHHLAPGDCLAFVLDEPVAFANPGDVRARYVVALATERGGVR